jgi:RNA polymerase sigma-70 factor, ECF subfamily
VAEDIAGQVFLEALEGIGRYRDEGKPITAWLLTIARHRSYDWLRKQRRVQQVPLAEHSSVVQPDGVSDALEAMQLLTAEQREVVFLRFVEGYPLEDVARLTNRSVGAVKSLQHRALENLRRQLAKTNEEKHR